MNPTEEMYNTLLDPKATEEEKNEVRFKIMFVDKKLGKITGFTKKEK